MAKKVELEIAITENSKKLDDIISRLEKLENTSNKIKKRTNISGGLFDVTKISSLIFSFERLNLTVENLTKKSSEFIENLNLTEVAFYGNTEQVKKLYTEMSNVYNLDESQIVRRIGIFKQMANAMQLPIEAGEELSELMNKMTIDIASLYNIDIDRASNALQSALVGQTRPINSSGLTLKSVMNKIVNTSKSGVRVITMLFKQEMAY